MTNVELHYLREKSEAYKDVINEISSLLPRHDPESGYYKALQSMIRTLQNQQDMIKWAIHSRELKACIPG